eukprot:scaffold124045_cov30-Tisochrysis_lutea.AAC.5
MALSTLSSGEIAVHCDMRNAQRACRLLASPRTIHYIEVRVARLGRNFAKHCIGRCTRFSEALRRLRYRGLVRDAPDCRADLKVVDAQIFPRVSTGSKSPQPMASMPHTTAAAQAPSKTDAFSPLNGLRTL